MDVGAHLSDELLDRGRLPVSRIEEFCFQPAEEALQPTLSFEQPLRHRANQLRIAYSEDSIYDRDAKKYLKRE